MVGLRDDAVLDEEDEGFLTALLEAPGVTVSFSDRETP
jgi:hypothetical protein